MEQRATGAAAAAIAAAEAGAAAVQKLPSTRCTRLWQNRQAVLRPEITMQ